MATGVRTGFTPQFIIVEVPLVPMSDVKNRACLVVESLEPTEDLADTRSPVPMSGTKDHPSLVDHSPAMPKVNNLCFGGRESGGGRFSNPPNKLGLSSHNYISYGGPPSARLGGGSIVCNGIRTCFCFSSENPITYGGS